MSEFNRELFEKWLAALRSGEYHQTRNYLRVDDAYCCLGVACDVINPSEDKWFKEDDDTPIYSLKGITSDYIAYRSLLPDDYSKMLGLNRKIPGNTIDTIATRLIYMNDMGYSFAEIADEAERLVSLTQGEDNGNP